MALHVDAQFQSLVDDPREALDIEVKQWIDLAEKPNQCTLARAIIAMANHGGGFVVVGFKEVGDGTFSPHDARPSALDRYSREAIAQIVATYAEPPFEIEVAHVARRADGQLYPVIKVPGGHRTPVMAKKGSADNKTLHVGRTYIRRPKPESAEPASTLEWRDLFDRCVRAARNDLLDAIRGVLEGREVSAPPPAVADRLASWVEDGVARWRALAPKSFMGTPLDPPGFYVAAYQIEGPLPAYDLSQVLTQLRDVPGFTGWRPWWVPTRDGMRPYPLDGAVQCYLGDEGDRRITDPAHADFWRVSNSGQALLIRGYDEDGLEEKGAEGTAIDVVLPIWRIAECLMHAAHFTERLVGEPRQITFQCSWSGLKGREIKSVTGRRSVSAKHRARQDDFVTRTTVNSAEIADQLPELVFGLLQPFYALFDFFELRKGLVDEEIHRMRAG